MGHKPTVDMTDLQSLAGQWRWQPAHWFLAHCGTDALFSTLLSNSFLSAGPPNRGLLWALKVGLNNSLGLLATWRQLCPGWRQLWRQPMFAGSPTLAWAMPPVGSPALSWAQRRSCPTTATSQLWQPRSTVHRAKAQPHVPLPRTAEGRPPVLAGHHLSSQGKTDQNKSVLGLAHKWALLGGSLNGSGWGGLQV